MVAVHKLLDFPCLIGNKGIKVGAGELRRSRERCCRLGLRGMLELVNLLP